MANKYEYPEDIQSPEDKRKYRRQQRALRAKEESGEGGETTQPQAKKPSRSRSKGGTVVTAPVEEDDDGEGDDGEEGEDDESELLRPFIARGLELNPSLSKGMGFSMRGGKVLNRGDVADRMLNKFFIRWGRAATEFRQLPGRVLIFGPLP